MLKEVTITNRDLTVRWAVAAIQGLSMFSKNNARSARDYIVTNIAIERLTIHLVRQNCNCVWNGYTFIIINQHISREKMNSQCPSSFVPFFYVSRCLAWKFHSLLLKVFFTIQTKDFSNGNMVNVKFVHLLKKNNSTCWHFFASCRHSSAKKLNEEFFKKRLWWIKSESLIKNSCKRLKNDRLTKPSFLIML